MWFWWRVNKWGSEWVWHRALAVWGLRTPFPSKALSSDKGLGTPSQGQRPLKSFPAWIIDYPFGYGTVWLKDSSNLKLFLLNLSKEGTLSKARPKGSIKIMKKYTHIYNFELLITHFGEVHMKQMAIEQNTQLQIESIHYSLWMSGHR